MAYKAGFRLAYTNDGGPPTIKNYPLVAGTAYHEGAVLRLSATTGSAQRAAAAGTSILGVLGCSVASADSGGTNKYPVYLANERNIFQAKMLASVAPQAKAGDLTDITLGTVHNYRLSSTASTNVVTIVGAPGDESTSAHTGCEFYVKFARSIFATTKSSNAA